MTRSKPKKIVTLRTDGSGYWTKRVSNVDVTKFEVIQTVASGGDGKTAPDTWGELRIYFDPAKWQTRRYGLIYTDNLFKKMLRDFLVKQGFSAEAAQDVGYSEQGMQGKDYVSCDVGEKFLNELDPLINFVKKNPVKIKIPVEKIYVNW